MYLYNGCLFFKTPMVVVGFSQQVGRAKCTLSSQRKRSLGRRHFRLFGGMEDTEVASLRTTRGTLLPTRRSSCVPLQRVRSHHTTEKCRLRKKNERQYLHVCQGLTGPLAREDSFASTLRNTSLPRKMFWPSVPVLLHPMQSHPGNLFVLQAFLTWW